MKIGYISTSFGSLTKEEQYFLLKAVGCKRIFIDNVDSTFSERSGLEKALAACSRKSTLCVTSLDSLATTVGRLAELSDLLWKNNSTIYSLADKLTGSQASGKSFNRVLQLLNRFIKKTAAQRTKYALESARQRGENLERKRLKISSDKLNRIFEDRARGRTIAFLVKRYSVSKSTIHRALRRARKAEPPKSAANPTHTKISTKDEVELIRLEPQQVRLYSLYGKATRKPKPSCARSRKGKANCRVRSTS